MAIAKSKNIRILEALAVVLNLLYTFFYLRSEVWCYAFGIAGPAVFIYLCFQKQLFGEVALQCFYILFAFYGIFHWGGVWHTEHWTLNQHFPYIIVGSIAAAYFGYYLNKYTKAQLPFFDGFTTVFAIIGTWIMVHYIHENWIYFIVINALSIYMYSKREMWLSAAMFLLYLVMSLDGYFYLGLFTS